MKKRLAVGGVIAVLAVAFLALVVLADTSATMFFSSDSSGNTKVTQVKEGEQVWIVVNDPDENQDCDVRDKIWTDVKVMDPKTGAYIVWISYKEASDCGNGKKFSQTGYVPYKGHYPGNSAGYLGADYLEETGANTGVFVSSRPFQIGARESYDDKTKNTHVVDNTWSTATTATGGISNPDDFQWGNFLYEEYGTPKESTRGWVKGDLEFNNITAGTNTDVAPARGTPAIMPSDANSSPISEDYLIGRFENMDTIVGMYQSVMNPSDVAVAMMKIWDTKSNIKWDSKFYDGNGSATITVTDPDENTNSAKVEYVPVFVLVNPGSWNVQTSSGVTVNSFCNLKSKGGYKDDSGAPGSQIRWYNIYNDRYILYPQTASQNVVTFDVDTSPSKWSGYSKVMFYAKETGPNTGVFEARFNDLVPELGFNHLSSDDVLVAYYLDPNDFDDFSLDTAYIGKDYTPDAYSVTSFVDASRNPVGEYKLSDNSIYVQVIDSTANADNCCREKVLVHVCDVHGEDDTEWLKAEETSTNSPIFVTSSGTELRPVWTALGNGYPGTGGYQLNVDNWKVEVFNEDQIYARYNDVYYKTNNDGWGGLGDRDTGTAFPPQISSTRDANDVSFATASIYDTEVFNVNEVPTAQPTMWFTNANGDKIETGGYASSDCVYLEVKDLDQNEDNNRIERIDGYWSGQQNFPFGPLDLNPWQCSDCTQSDSHEVNALLGDMNIANDGSAPNVYVFNPRNGRWVAVDLMETTSASGDFVSLACIPLASQYAGVPTLDAKSGDTIVAVYQDPSNHSDSAWISIKVGMTSSSGIPNPEATTATFSDSTGATKTSFQADDSVYVTVSDVSHAGDVNINDAVTISGVTYSLHKLVGAANNRTFITDAITGLPAGDVTATYVDPDDATDTKTATATIEAGVFTWEPTVTPNPFSDYVTFSYGTGAANSFTVSIYDLAGYFVTSLDGTGSNTITWDGAGCGNGPYMYVMIATDADDTPNFQKGTVYIRR